MSTAIDHSNTSSDTIHEESPLLTPVLHRDIPVIRDDEERTGTNTIRENYIVSLLRRTSTFLDEDDSDDSEPTPIQGTTHWETVIHLVKGYIGCGILSLPWAVSQLGIPIGVFAIGTLSLWTSYNCWTVVKLKRYIEQTRGDCIQLDENDDDEHDLDDEDDLSSKLSSSRPRSVSSQVTYPDVGDWAYGARFQKYVTFCICAQQLAICTVFVGFVGENLFATLNFWGIHETSRRWITTLCLPVFVGLSCAFPSLESMTSLMVLGTMLMVLGFALIGWIGFLQWDDRPKTFPEFHLDTNAAMALCGILYSFEGICIILPVESVIQKKKEFLSAFGVSMTIVTMLLCGMATLGVVAFGRITNGSLTAFLLEEYQDDPTITLWLVLSNALVSLSIVVSYPLQLFPAVELVAQTVRDRIERARLRDNPRLETIVDNSVPPKEGDLEGFEPMEGIPEHGVPSMRSLPYTPEDDGYPNDVFTPKASNSKGVKNTTLDDQDSSLQSTFVECSEDPPDETIDSGGPFDSSASLLSRLSSNLSYQRSIIDEDDNLIGQPGQWKPGDSPALRASLVVGTVLVAVLVPKVQSLVSLVGAVTGSSTALLIPPILQLAYIRHRETLVFEATAARARKSSLLLMDPSPASTVSDSPPLQPYAHGFLPNNRTKSHYFWNRVLSWCLLLLGTLFAVVGSYFSVQDIVNSYS